MIDRALLLTCLKRKISDGRYGTRSVGIDLLKACVEHIEADAGEIERLQRKLACIEAVARQPEYV